MCSLLRTSWMRINVAHAVPYDHTLTCNAQLQRAAVTGCAIRKRVICTFASYQRKTHRLRTLLEEPEIRTSLALHQDTARGSNGGSGGHATRSVISPSVSRIVARCSSARLYWMCRAHVTACVVLLNICSTEGSARRATRRSSHGNSRWYCYDVGNKFLTFALLGAVYDLQSTGCDRVHWIISTHERDPAGINALRMHSSLYYAITSFVL